MNSPLQPRFRRHRRRSPALVVLVGLSFITAACSSGSSASDASTPDPNVLPATSTFQNPDGSESTLADYSGTPVVLNFFASWCAPCRAELPEFERVSQEVAGDVQFLGVNTDFDADAWLGLVETTGVTYPTVFQPSNELFRASGALGMPTTLFIGSDGVTKHAFTGPLTEQRLRELIDEHLTS